MDIVNLVEYVKEGELFEKVDFDQVVSDFDFSEFDLDNFFKIDNFLDLRNVDKSKKTLFILDKLLPENILDFFDMKNITILDLNSGLFSYGHKIGISKLDVMSIINSGFQVFEPIDLFSFLSCFDFSGKNFIKVANVILPENFVKSEFKDIVSLENYGFASGNMSILCTGIFFTEVIRLGNLLSEQGLFVKIFVLNKLNFDDLSLLENENNLVFIFDNFESIEYCNYIKKKFVGKKIKFIYPKYGMLSTVFDDYKLEELEFDVLGIAKNLGYSL